MKTAIITLAALLAVFTLQGCDDGDTQRFIDACHMAGGIYHAADYQGSDAWCDTTK